MSEFQFDLIVIGAGPGGYVAALEAAKLKKRVAVCEAREVGGTCLNRGCIPTKALLRAAHIYHEASHSEGLGVKAQNVEYDMAAMHMQVDSVTMQLRGGIEALFKKEGVTLLRGRGTIMAHNTVTVAGETYTTEKILIATGSNPARPPIPGLDLPGVVTSDELLQNGGVDCKRLIVIGGGVVGVEFAQVYSDLGCEITIIEALPRLLPTMDREISQNLQMIFKKRGIGIHTGAKVSEIVQGANGLVCRYIEKDEALEAEADFILVCTGRKPNTDSLLAPDSGVELETERGFIKTDNEYRTSVDYIYAVGDVVFGAVQLAHAAEAAGRNAVCVMFGLPAVKKDGVIPGCVFTRPEIASVGITADEAKAQGIAVKVEKNLTSANGRALIEGADRGFVKLVIDEATDKLLGVQLMCPHSSEMLGGMTAAVVNGMTAKELAQTVFPHPTVSETILG